MNLSSLYLKLDYHDLTIWEFKKPFLSLTSEQGSLQFKIRGRSFSNTSISYLGGSRQHLLKQLDSRLIYMEKMWRSTLIQGVGETINWYKLLEGNLNPEGISVRIKNA